MKKALIISSIIFVVSIIAFGISVAATGLREGNFAVAIGLDKVFDGEFEISDNVEKVDKHFDFDKSVEDISIDILSAEAEVEVADVDKISVDYKGDNRRTINASIEGDKLIVKESANFVVTFINWNFGNNEAELKITLPRKEYDDVKINVASGTVSVDGLISKDFSADSASGDMNYSIYAEDIDVGTLSGSVELKNCTDKKAKSLRISSTSGNHSVSGFGTEKFVIDSMSGSVDAEGISGEGEVTIASGRIDLSYSEWDGELGIDAASGLVDITLPEDAGVIVELSAISGSVEVDLTSDTSEGAATAKLSGDCSSGTIGGSNVHKVDIDLASGDVDIHN